MSIPTITVSAEELALALGEAGHAATGRALLGDLGQSELEAALRSAAHSLMARGLAALNTADVVTVGPPLVALAGTLMRAHFSIRFSRFDEWGERHCTYHFCGDIIVGQHVSHGVIHSLSELGSAAECVAGGADLLEAAGTQAFASLSCVLPDDLLNAFAGGEPTITAGQLHSWGAPDILCGPLAEDFAAPQLHGSVLRVEYPSPGPVAERGLLVLRGAERLWLMRPFLRHGASFVTVLAGTEQLFRQEVEALLAS